MTHDAIPPCRCACAAGKTVPPDPGRRQMIAGALAATLPLVVPAGAHAQGMRKPEPGDRLVFMSDTAKVIKPEDLVAGAPPTMAYPADGATGSALSSKANLLTVVRIKADAMKPSSAKNAADGVVAFSAVCTHYGCPVTTLHPSQTQVVCNCHGSIFDAADRGTVTQGPATRRLAMLPLALKDGALVVSGKFDGPIGPPT